MSSIQHAGRNVKRRVWVAGKQDRYAFVHPIVIIAVVAILVIGALLIVYVLIPSNETNSSNSPSGSNNNTSGPSNITLLPGQASALVVVTIHSTHSIFEVHYVLYLDSNQKAEGDIAAHSSVIQTMTLVFPENQTGLYKAVILATSSGGGLGNKSDQVVVTPVNNGTYPVTLNI
jgi:hypothetical protein